MEKTTIYLWGGGGGLINQREHAQSVGSNVTIYSIICKEEENVSTLVSGVH